MRTKERSSFAHTSLGVHIDLVVSRMPTGRNLPRRSGVCHNGVALPQKCQQEVTIPDNVAVLISGFIITMVVLTELVSNLVTQDALVPIGLDFSEFIAVSIP